MGMEQWWNGTDRGKQKYWEETFADDVHERQREMVRCRIRCRGDSIQLVQTV